MAAHGAPEYSVAEGNDYPAHEQTYLGFLSLVKWIMGCHRHHPDRDGLFSDVSGWAPCHGGFAAPAMTAGGRWRHDENRSRR